ncbi:MAG: MFS transporter [Planctomycetes bacterium]|nr:MFS transporter [Planctomycetota bacterium]
MMRDGERQGAGPAAAEWRPLARLLRPFIVLEPREAAPLVWSFLCAFFLFFSYFIVKPLRDEMGVSQGAKNLPNLFLVTLVTMAVVHLLFAALVSKSSRRTFLPVLFRTIALVLLLFCALFRAAPPALDVWLARAFYVWVSVYNLLAVSVFWGLMADSFHSGQSKRLYAFIAAGLTIGGIAGAGFTSLCVGILGASGLVVAAALILELVVWCARRFMRCAAPAARERAAAAGQPLVRGALEGVQRVVQRPYLIGICLFMFFYTFTSTALNLERASIIEAAISDSERRVALFANREFVVQSLTLVVQLLLAGRFIRWAGISLGLALVPLISLSGFGALLAAPTLAVVMTFDVLRAFMNYAVAHPCREALYTVLDRAEKYKSKNFIDTFVYRGGDAFAALSQRAGGLVLALAVLVSLAWTAVALLLGRRQRQLAGEGAT